MKLSKGQSQPETAAAAFLILYMALGRPLYNRVFIMTQLDQKEGPSDAGSSVFFWPFDLGSDSGGYQEESPNEVVPPFNKEPMIRDESKVIVPRTFVLLSEV